MRQKEQKKLKHNGRKHIPLPTGPHPVGCVDLMTGYTIDGSFMRLFYPCVSNAHTLEKQLQWPAWLPHEKYLNGYANFLKIWKPLFRVGYRLTIGDVFIPAIWNAEPAPRPNEDRFPVVVFSHGVAACRTTYTTICLELASHGYIVAAVEHRDNSACHTYFLKQGETEENLYKIETDGQSTDDGYHYPDDFQAEVTTQSKKTTPIREWVTYDNRSLSTKEYPNRKRQLCQRTEECVRALDLLEALNNGDTVVNTLDPYFKADRFKGIMDTSKATVAGHSFGGATTINTLALDLRFKVGICLDTWMVPLMRDDDILAAVSQPILFVNMERFQTKPNLKLMSKLDNGGNERKIVTIKGSVHLDQCDMNFISGWLHYKVFGGFSGVDRFTAIDTTTRLTLDFMGKHLDTKIETEWEDYIKKQKKKLKHGIKPKLRTPVNPSFVVAT